MLTDVEPELRRISLRAWRRGTKEMDLLLGPWADARLPQADEPARAAIEALLAEEDGDVQAWILGRTPAPSVHADAVHDLRAFHRIV